MREARNPWVAGTVGMQVALALRRAFGMDQAADDTPWVPSQRQLMQLAAGTHPTLDMRVVDHPESDSRWFSLQERWGSSTLTFRSPRSSITPVSEIEIRDFRSQITYRLQVLRFDPAGEPVHWSESKLHPGKGRLKEMHYTLLHQELSPDFSDEPFSLSQPEGWTLFDHRPDEVLVWNEDGVPFEQVITVPGPEPSAGSANGGKSVSWKFFLPQAIALTVLIYAWYVQRGRRLASMH